MIFSLAAYEEGLEEPAQARQQQPDMDRPTHRQHLNWALLSPPFAQLFCGPSSFYLDALEATVGRRRQGTGASTPNTVSDIAEAAEAAAAAPSAAPPAASTAPPPPTTVFQRVMTAQESCSLRTVEL